MSRSLEQFKVTVDADRNPVLECLCDCATWTNVVVKVGEDTDRAEFAYTCDGCGTSHWFTIESA